MLIEDLKKLLPVMQAFAEGKTIQYFNDDKNDWEDISKHSNVTFENDPDYYRIKPEQKYRPFKSVEECWNEMQKHKPVGWLKSKISPQFYSSYEISENSNWDYRFNTYTFADGTPYGIKEE